MHVEQPTTTYRKTKSSYDKYPKVKVSSNSADCLVGWPSIIRRLSKEIHSLDQEKKVVVVETYHGVLHEVIKEQLIKLPFDHVISSFEVFAPEPEINARMVHLLGDHPVFGFMGDFDLEQYFESDKLNEKRAEIDQLQQGTVLIIGPGATLLAEDHDILVYTDMARWEIQQRMRRGLVANLGAQNHDALIAEKYKRAYFVDWRACDKHKQQLISRWDYVLDTHIEDEPKLVSGKLVREGLQKCVTRPFRVVPFFDPGVWGGQWMKEVCDLPQDAPNYAWCFDCVPEENSLLLSFGKNHVEIPSLNLLFFKPRLLLGEEIFSRFGAEFPIRFDFLDTMDGGNLSLQVHPVQSYMEEHFGLPYTQDESYYLLDAGPDAVVYLGQKSGADPDEMIKALEQAQITDEGFPAENYVEKWPVRKHDHILIPAGTVHCSGKNSMVLEISATPYIFTFKLWDWGRVDLDGRPRPISLDHGKRVIQWNRSTDWVQRELINRVQLINQGPGWREERTGLHDLQFIETRRHWFTGKVHHDTAGNLNVLNLIEGDEVIVESPIDAFEPFVVHYAETFIVPASVGQYTIRPSNSTEGREYATIKAFVRPENP